ncbi:MAG TPA: NnrU family protein [Trueperaceae bacterium]|nr:NnrU family protein [Trueperaceae bacterium]
MTKRWTVFLFGALSYLITLGVFAELIVFAGDLPVSRTVDGPPPGAGGPSLALDLVLDLGLIALFGLQHSLMARPAVKRALARLVPAAALRSLYVLLAGAALAVLMRLWRPLPGALWHASRGWPHALLTALFAGGWLTVLGCTFLVGHFDLLGLRQVTLELRGRPYTPLPFVDGGIFGLVRHPLMLAFLAAFWIVPVMGWGHLLLAAGMTGYILVGIAFEERDLERAFGERYRRYRARVPMLVPGLRVGRRGAAAGVSTAAGRGGER